MKIDIRKGYMEQRRRAYPTIADQLDMLYHDPDKWRETIKAVKEMFPKPPLP